MTLGRSGAECEGRALLGLRSGSRAVNRMAPANGAMPVNTRGDESTVVRGEPDVRSMKAHLLSDEREHPVIALT